VDGNGEDEVEVVHDNVTAVLDEAGADLDGMDVEKIVWKNDLLDHLLVVDLAGVGVDNDVEEDEGNHSILEVVVDMVDMVVDMGYDEVVDAQPVHVEASFDDVSLGQLALLVDQESSLHRLSFLFLALRRLLHHLSSYRFVCQLHAQNVAFLHLTVPVNNLQLLDTRQ
jgi:hypothetical protein